MGKEYPLVSVIIPVYNALDSIDKTLTSVINQTYAHLEIIVVNDGSTDDSLGIIKKYATEDSRIVIFDKQNKGLVQARKSGIDIATGKYIQYLDSDDVLYEDAITLLVNKAEDTQSDIVVAPFLFCYDDGEVRESVSFDFSELSGTEYLKKVFKREAYWCVWSKFHLRSLYQNEIERLGISLGEDVVLSTQLLIYSQRVTSIDSIIVNYNFTSTSMSHPATFDDDKYRDFVMYVAWVDNFITKKGLKDEFRECLASFHLENSFRRIYWKRFVGIGAEMRILMKELESFPELTDSLTRRERRILKSYRASNIIGRLRLMYYNWCGKI